MEKKIIFTPGQKVVLLRIGNNARSYSPDQCLVDAVVEKVGNKYVTVNHGSNFYATAQFDMTNPRFPEKDNQNRNYDNWKLYLDRSAIEAEIKYEKLYRKIQDKFKYYSSNIINEFTMEQLEQIDKILFNEEGV